MRRSLFAISTSLLGAAAAMLVAGCGSDAAAPVTQSSLDGGADVTADSPSGKDGSPGEAGSESSTHDAPIDNATDSITPIDAAPDTTPPPDDPTCTTIPSTQVIALWDVVPLQRFEGALRVGVVAFHEQGVEVTFSVNGSQVGTVDVPTLNPDSSVVEYWVELQASDYADGEVKLTAQATSDCPGNIPRDLPEVVMYANSKGSLSNPAIRFADCATGSDEPAMERGDPYKTIEKAFVEVGNGGTVQLAAGSCYALTDLYPAAGYTHWTTVEPGPGVGRDAVRIRADAEENGATGRFGEDMVRWKGVGIYKDTAPGYGTIFYFESGHHVWFDHTELYDTRGKNNGGQLVGGNSPFEVYATGAWVHDIENVGLGFQRNVLAENIGSDVIRGSSNLLAVNLTVKTIDVGETEAHPDFVQFYNPDSTVDNMIIYNASVTNMGAQGLFGGPGTMRNIAFVNLLMEKDPADSYLISQFSGDWDHVLLWHITTVDSGMLIRDPMNLHNVWVLNNNLAGLSGYDNATLSAAAWVIDYNQYAALSWDQTEPLGTHATVGASLFMDVNLDDYRLAPGSPGLAAGIPIAGVPADIDGRPYHPQHPSLGAFEAP